jgi:hypothetical protein
MKRLTGGFDSGFIERFYRGDFVILSVLLLVGVAGKLFEWELCGWRTYYGYIGPL